MELKQKVLEYLKSINPKLCVIATATDNKPECAVMAFVVLDDLSLIISTHSNTRKWENIGNNKNVAVTFGWDFIKPNIQYEGIATQVEPGKNHDLHQKVYFEAHPELEKFKRPDTVFIKITPTWVRLTDLTAKPPTIEQAEIK